MTQTVSSKFTSFIPFSKYFLKNTNDDKVIDIKNQIQNKLNENNHITLDSTYDFSELESSFNFSLLCDISISTEHQALSNANHINNKTPQRFLLENKNNNSFTDGDFSDLSPISDKKESLDHNITFIWNYKEDSNILSMNIDKVSPFILHSILDFCNQLYKISLNITNVNIISIQSSLHNESICKFLEQIYKLYLGSVESFQFNDPMQLQYFNYFSLCMRLKNPLQNIHALRLKDIQIPGYRSNILVVVRTKDYKYISTLLEQIPSNHSLQNLDLFGDVFIEFFLINKNETKKWLSFSINTYMIVLPEKYLRIYRRHLNVHISSIDSPEYISVCFETIKNPIQEMKIYETMLQKSLNLAPARTLITDSPEQIMKVPLDKFQSLSKKDLRTFDAASPFIAKKNQFKQKALQKSNISITHRKSRYSFQKLPSASPVSPVSNYNNNSLSNNILKENIQNRMTCHNPGFKSEKVNHLSKSKNTTNQLYIPKFLTQKDLNIVNIHTTQNSNLFSQSTQLTPNQTMKKIGSANKKNSYINLNDTETPIRSRKINNSKEKNSNLMSISNKENESPKYENSKYIPREMDQKEDKFSNFINKNPIQKEYNITQLKIASNANIKSESGQVQQKITSQESKSIESLNNSNPSSYINNDENIKLTNANLTNSEIRINQDQIKVAISSTVSQSTQKELIQPTLSKDNHPSQTCIPPSPISNILLPPPPPLQPISLLPSIGAPPPPLPSFNGIPPPPPLNLNQPLVTPLKPLHWRKLPQNKVKHSLWASIQESNIEDSIVSKEDEQEIEILFAKTNISSKPKKMKVAKKSFESIVGTARAQNIEIVLSQFKKFENISMSLIDIIENLKLEDISSTNTTSLLQCLPNLDEQKRFQDFEGDFNSLTNGDKFLHSLLKVKKIHKKLQSFLYLQSLPQMYIECKEMIDIKIRAFNSIISSQQLALAMKITLMVGNTLNRSSRNGNAEGFSIDVLPKLGELKATDGKSTLLHFVVKKMIRNDINSINKLKEELLHLKDSIRINSKTIKSQLEEIESYIQHLKNTSQDLNVNPNDYSTNFKERFNKQSQEVFNSHEALLLLWKEYHTLFEKSAQYFGEELNDKSEEIVRILVDFVNKCDKCAKDIIKNDSSTNLSMFNISTISNVTSKSRLETNLSLDRTNIQRSLSSSAILSNNEDIQKPKYKRNLMTQSCTEMRRKE